MKLLKKIIPLATVASAAAIVTPFVTSCSNGVIASASSFDYGKNMRKHDKETIKYTDKTKVKELAKEYFSNRKHFAEDFCYMRVQSYAKLKEQLVAEGYKDVDVNFNVAVKDLSFKETTIKYQLPGASEETDVTGYLANYDVVYSRTYTYSVENPTNEIQTYTKYKLTLEANETDSIRNAFLFWHGMEQTPTVPTIWGCYNDKASDKWEWRDSEKYTLTEEWTYKDGTVIVDKENASASDYYSNKVIETPTYAYEIMQDQQLYYTYDDTWEPTGKVYVNIGSNYLSQVTIEI